MSDCAMFISIIVFIGLTDIGNHIYKVIWFSEINNKLDKLLEQKESETK